MSFTKINNQGVHSDLGFEVQVVSRYVIEYRERGAVISIGYEAGATPAGDPRALVSHASFSAWDGWPVGVRFDAAEQARIERNFVDAMEYQGLPVIFD